jgi:hypothetical protein
MMKKFSALVVTIWILAGCAGQRPPEGGPLDTVPPEIISVYPAPNTVNFSDRRVAFEFSEYVDRRSVEEAIFISPNIEEIEFDWGSTEVELIFREPLRKNTTYVITVGTDVVDVRNRNRMADAFSVSFSTGEKIDNGMISGKIYDDDPRGVMIFSYRMNEIDVDTLNPIVTKPDYITQTGNDGRFSLINLAAGTYRLFAIKDEYRNLLYDPEIDAAGTSEDVTITASDSVKSGVTFIVAKEDTTSPRIMSVTAPDDRHVVVQFSEPMDSATVRAGRFAITDTTGKNSLPVEGLFPNRTPVNSFTIISASQKADTVYLLTADSVRDRSGFTINPMARQKQFKGSNIRDTVPPSLISSTISEGKRSLLPDRSIDLLFTDALLSPLNDSAFQLVRLRDSSSVPITFRPTGPAAVQIQPARSLIVDERYSLRMRWDHIKDIFGNHHKDSATTYEFSIEDPEQYGSIEGAFAGFGGTAPVVILANNISDKKQQPAVSVLNPFGTFMFTFLPEGRYTLKAFEDPNANFIHDAGTVYPFRRSEKFVMYGDTIRVRPRWPVDGVLIGK